MELLTRWVDNKSWFKTDFDREIDYIKTFYDIKEAEEKLRDHKIICCGIKLFKMVVN